MQIVIGDICPCALFCFGYVLPIRIKKELPVFGFAVGKPAPTGLLTTLLLWQGAINNM